MYYWAITMVALAILSLLRRIWELRLIPTEELIKVLNIDIPKASKICIDNITESKAYIHWELPTQKDSPAPSNNSKAAYFMIFVNDKQLLVLNANEYNICLSKLIPDTCYKLDLITVNANGYKSKSDSVHIRTKSTKIHEFQNKLVLENPESLFKLLTFNQGDISSIHKLTSPLNQNASNIIGNSNGKESNGSTGNGSSRVGRSRSNTLNSDFNAVNQPAASNMSVNLIQDPRGIDDIQELRFYLETGQDDLRSILRQQDQAYKDFKEQEALLIKERDSLRERVKLDINNKKALVSETKMLEDSRRLVELKKKKMVANLEKRKKMIQEKKEELAKWNKMIDEFDVKKQKFIDSEENIHDQLDIDIKSMKEKISTLHLLLSNVEEEYKRVNPKRRHCEGLKPNLIKVLKSVNENMDKSGCLNLEGIKSLESLKDYDQEIYTKLKEVVDQDSRLEAEWRAQQQKEVNNCIQVSKSFDIVKSENHQIKQTLQSQTFPQTSDTPPQSYPMVNQIPPQLSTSSNNGSYGFPPLNQHQQNLQVPYNYELSGSNPSLNSFQQQGQGQQSNTSLWQNYRNTTSSFNNSNGAVTSSNGSPLNRIPNNLSLRIPPNGFDYLNDYDTLDSPSAAQSFLPTNLIGDDGNFFNSSSAAGLFSNVLQKQAQDSSSPNLSNTLLQNNGDQGGSLLNNNNTGTTGNASLNFHYQNQPQNKDDITSNSRSLFLGGSSNFSFDNNVNSGLLGTSVQGSNLTNSNSPPHSHEFLSAHNSPNQVSRTTDLNSMLSLEGSNMDFKNHQHLRQLSQGQNQQGVNFGHTIDAFVTANSNNGVLPNDQPLNDSVNDNGGNNSGSQAANGSARRFSSIFSLSFGKKSNASHVEHHAGNDSVTSSPKHQHSKFFKPSSESSSSEVPKPSSNSSMGTTVSSVPHARSSTFSFINNNHVGQLDLWNTQGSGDFGPHWDGSMAQQQSMDQQIHESNHLTEPINKIPTNTQKSIASSQVIDEEDEKCSETGSEIGVPAQQTITNKSFTSSMKSRGSHSAEGPSSPSFFRSKFLSFGEPKSPNKNEGKQQQQQTAKIDDSELEEYQPSTNSLKSSLFSPSSNSSLRRKSSRKVSSSSGEDNGSIGNLSGSGNEGSSNLKGFRRLSLFNGRNNSNSHATKEDAREE